jgi:hypothetical protein
MQIGGTWAAHFVSLIGLALLVAAAFAITNPSSPELFVDQSCSAAPASKAFDRASQNSQIALAVDSG